jgi:PAS domain S-box-containing protein
MHDPAAPVETFEAHQALLSRKLDECREACESARAECRRLRLIMDNAPVLLAYLDTEHRYRFVNSAYALRFGGELNEVLGRSVAEVLGEEVWSQIRSYRERVVAGEALDYEVDVEVRAGQQQRMHCVLNPARDSEGEVVGYVIAITDVTDRKRVAEARDLLAAIVESSDDAIVSVTPDGQVTSWNAGATHLFGYGANEMVGQSLQSLTSPGSEQAVLERIGRGDVVRHFETVRFAKDGRRLDISLSAAPMRDHAGRIVGVAEVARDITEAKKTEAAIKASEEALRDADRRKDEFLALLAHELRNPLAPLVNAVELLRSAGADPTLRRVRDMMDRQLRQLQRLVDDLLDVSRISRGRFELRRGPVEVGVAIETAVEACNALVSTRRHALTISVPPESLLVEGDFARLTQIFANLISNSAKYTEPGGRIDVALHKSDNGAVVTVSDTGIGIPSESLDVVFDMFSQVQAHKLYAGGGLGIGLALVRSLVEMHGGSVDVQSEGSGRGSTFRVWLPLMHDPSPLLKSSRRGDAREANAPHKRRVLIADDNIDAAASLSLLLQLRGHETRTASNGLQAVELAAAFRPEIIFMDLGMPLLDGLEACRRIRAQPDGPSIVIVALTGWGQHRDRAQTRAAGMDLHLVKPIDLDGIAAVETQCLIKGQDSQA